jgi:tRNA-dihydrouridine synthase B
MLFKNKNLILAPMAGIGDSVFRQICKSQGADITVSEMVSSEGLFYNSQNTANLMCFKEIERPIGIQLFGANPEHLGLAAKFVTEHVNPDFIDLNAGCPAPKVVCKNGGSSLLKDANLFERILTALVKSTHIPVTVKIRSGWHKYQWVDTEFAKIAENCGVSAITVHPRSQTMGFTGHSFWDRIAAVKQAVSIPVIGNGDILSPEDALQMINETGCDALMIGRGTYGNPWLFNHIKNTLDNKPLLQIGTKERKAMALTHLELFKEQCGEIRASKEMKKHLAWYIKGMPDATILRDQVFRSEDYATLIGIFEKIDDQ